MGRARAWLRLALMQKRLADYLRIILEHREDTLEEYFEPHALMLNEEAVIITGLLVGLNVVDCNLCVKVNNDNQFYKHHLNLLCTLLTLSVSIKYYSTLVSYSSN